MGPGGAAPLPLLQSEAIHACCVTSCAASCAVNNGPPPSARHPCAALRSTSLSNKVLPRSPGGSAAGTRDESAWLPDQAYVTRARMESFSLTADMMYVSQNAPRICRALFEICLRRGWSTAAEMALTMCKVRSGAHPQKMGNPLGVACSRRCCCACLQMLQCGRPSQVHEKVVLQLALWSL